MIKIETLTKSYGKDKGVFDLTFQVRLPGSQGAGKTTTIPHLLSHDPFRCHRDHLKDQQRPARLRGPVPVWIGNVCSRYLRFIQKGSSPLGE
jgi:ABC-type Na+ transport system ATPase subunit NatA